MSDITFRAALRWASAAALATAGWWFLGDLWAPESCMDAGGVFDDARWLCSFDERERFAAIDVPIGALPSLPTLCACVLAFAIAWMLPAGRSRHGAGHRD